MKVAGDSTSSVVSEGGIKEYGRAKAQGCKPLFDYDGVFLKLSSQLSEPGAKLVSAMINHASSVHGGQLADCSLCKTLMTLRSYKPSELRKMVCKVGSCDYQISLPGHARFIVKLPSNAKMTFNCMAQNDCRWQEIINTACTRLKPLAPSVAIRVLP